MKNEALILDLSHFQGPLDLLLHLIQKNKVDIYDIPIVEITEQYMCYIQDLDNPMEEMSSFLVMAATLIAIKTRMLVPQYDAEEDPRSELVSQLLAYEYFQKVAKKLHTMEAKGGKSLMKNPTLPDEVTRYEPKPDVDAIFEDITCDDLIEHFQRVIHNFQTKIDTRRSTFQEVADDRWTIENCMSLLVQKLQKGRQLIFQELCLSLQGTLHIAMTFLALLELIKQGKVRIEQEDNFAPLKITWRRSHE